MEKSFREYLSENKFILHCGATGSEMIKRGGATPGIVNNVLFPDAVLEIQKSYVDAGAVIALANTFGANPLYAATHAKGYDWKELNRLGVQFEKKAAAGRAYVMGNIGPVGELLEPLGSLKTEEVYDSVYQQAEILKKEGIDGFSVQTYYDLNELKATVKAIRAVSDLPIIASMVFTKQGATMMGNTPEKAYRELLPLAIDVFGHNCGDIDFYSLGDLLEPLAKEAEIPLCALPNAGSPRNIDGAAVYPMTPEEFRNGVLYLKSKNIRILGGCCGVHIEHIKAIADLF
jgi:methionine synthase I (cobalamin-dependent)